MIERGMDADSRNFKSRSTRWLSLALIICACVAGIYLLAPQTVGEQARRAVLNLLRSHYSGVRVTIGSGRFNSAVGLVFEDIRFELPPTANRRAQSLLKIDRLIVETDANWQRLSERENPFSAKRIIAIGVELDTWMDANGMPSMARLWPPPKMGPGCPRLEVRNGRLRFHPDNLSVIESSVRPIELDHFELAVNSVVGESIETSRHAFAVEMSSEFAKQVSAKGTFVGGVLAIEGSAKSLRIDPATTSRLPGVCDEVALALRGVTAIGDLQFAAKHKPDLPLDFIVKWNCANATVEHPSLPLPIESISGLISLHPAGVTLESVQCTIGDAIAHITGQTRGLGTDADLSLRLRAANLMLNERLASALPITAQQSLDKFRPRGPIDIDTRVDRTAGQWKADAVVDLLGVDISVDRFPYPVSGLIGKVNFRESQVWSENLSGRLQSQRINIAFLRSAPTSGKATWLTLAADGAIPIDSTLLTSLTPRGEPQSKLEQFVRSLSPRGTVHLLDGRWDTDPAGQKTQRIELQVNSGNLRYSGFPYSLYDVTGNVVADNDNVKLIGFRGKNGDNATIRCEGLFENLTRSAARSPQGDWQLGLRFNAENLPLDETIRAALPAKTQQTWDAIAPAGVVDHVEVQLSHAQSYTAPRLMIAAELEPTATVDSRTVSVRPTMLPYRLDLTQGRVRYDGQQVWIDSLEAKHDSTHLAVDGRCVLDAADQWRLDLNIRSGSRLHPDSELISSLPPQMRGAFQRLQLRGPLSIRGATSILLPSTDQPEPTIDWGLTVQLEGNRIGDVGPVHDIRGELIVKGRRDEAVFSADGLVSIDSLHIDDKQVTSIRGPFAVRDDRLILGESIATLEPPPRSLAASRPRTVSPIQGRVFDGVASMSGDVVLSNGNFDVAISMADGDVATALADLGESHSGITGKIEGRVRLEGTVGAAHLLKGAGSGRLSDANLYQLPILVQVFNMLRVKPSEAVAFTDGEVRYSIYGDNITFDQLQLWGDLIALHGSGTMNRTREVDLSFNTRVSPQNGWSQVMRPFGENEYTLWTISVKGPLSDPLIERRTLNAVNETIERLFPGIAVPAERPGPISSRVDGLRDKFR